MPEVSRNITSFRTLSQAVGTNFGQMDYHYFILQMLYLVEYASYHSQTILGNGYTGLRYKADDKALIAESSTNRIVINSTGGAAFVVNHYINIGTAVGNASIAKHRKITAIADYDDGTVTGKAITFDGAAVNIAVNNIVSSSIQKTGDCDSLGMKSGMTGTNGKHGIIYRGIENIFGNASQFVDGFNLKDRVAYINYNPSTYAVNTFTGDYSAVGYTNASSSGYIKTIGYDANHPLIMLPTVKGGSSSTYVPDYYAQATGNRIAYVGGNISSGAYSGMFYWQLGSASTTTGLFMSSRILKY